MSLFYFSLNVCLVFSKSIEFGSVLCKLVVESGKFLKFKTVELALEGCVLACKFCRMVFFREGYVYVEFVAYVLANDLIFKTGNERTRAEL